MFSRLSRFHDPDDSGGQGQPDDDGTGTSTPAPAANDLKDVAASIRAAILEARAVAPVAPAFAPAPVADNREATRRALLDEGAQVNAKFDELVNAGRASEAMALRDDFQRRANASLAAPQDDNVIVKTAVALGERAARNEHADVMKRWGDEVRRAVDGMPLDERVQPDAWDKAVSRVKTNHFDELFNERLTEKVEEAKRQFIPPPTAPGSRGTRPTTGAASKLNEEQLWGADLCGVDPAEYAKEFARETAYDALPFKERGPFPGYPLVSNVVKPGGF